MEIWKVIEDYEGLYEVSDHGRIRNQKGKILSSRYTKTGYELIDLYKNKSSKTFYVHRLVASTFIDNPDNLPCVNHKDENKQNNNVDNLEFCSIAYNNTYNGRAKRVGEHLKKHHKLCKKIKCIETGEIFESVRCAGRMTGICSISISYCLNGKQKHAGGYTWEVV